MNYDKLADQLALCAEQEQEIHQRIGMVVKAI
jgi:hypothetical protein